MRTLLPLLLIACTPDVPDSPTDGPTDDTDPGWPDVEPSDAIVPLGAVHPGERRVIHIMDIALASERAWLASYAGAIGVDVGVPEQMEVTATQGPGRLYGVDIEGDRLVFSGRESGANVMRHAGDGQLARVSRYFSEDEAAERATLHGDHVLVAALTGGLVIRQAPGMDPPMAVVDLPNAAAVAVQGDLAAVGDRERGLVLVDLATGSPRIVGEVAIPGAAQDLAFVDDTVWIAAGGDLIGVDISDPSSPRIVANVATMGVATRLDASGSLLAVATWSDTRLYDVSDAASPVLLALEDATDSATSVALDGDLLLVGDWDELRSYRVVPDAMSAELSAARSALVVGEGLVQSPVPLNNDGPLPLLIDGVSCDDGRVTPVLSEDLVPPGRVGLLRLEVETGGASFEATCTLRTSDFDEPAHPIAVRVNPPGRSVGDIAPDFSLPDLDGNVHHLTDTRGKVLVMSLFSSL